MLTSLARIEQKITDFEVLSLERAVSTARDYGTIISRLDKVNGNIDRNRSDISTNKQSLSKIIGYGMGVAFVLGLAISIVALVL